MMRLWLGVLVVVGMGALGVALLIARPPDPEGYCGLQFTQVTEAAASRAPLLATRGALVLDVADDSPAGRAGIRPGVVVAKIDGEDIRSARQASEIVRRHRAGDRVILTLFDEPRGRVRPKDVPLVFDAAPPANEKIYSIDPPRTLAKEKFAPPVMAANAAWSRRLTHGVSVRARALPQLTAGICTGVAPEKWQVRDSSKDMIHVVSDSGSAHAIYKLVRLNADQKHDPLGYVSGLLREIFRSPVAITPVETRPFGINSISFGNKTGATGFALWRLSGDILSVWIAGVPASDIAWAIPVTGSVLLSLRCQSDLAPASRPRDLSMAATSVSSRCLDNRCEDSDFAAIYLDKFRLGYVHARNGEVFLVNPRRDLWVNGQEGPGFYRQLGGQNEKLEPGRTN
jgi:hypothetical protein